MWNVISFELAKKLNWKLDDLVVEKCYINHSDWHDLEDFMHFSPWDFKAPNFEELTNFVLSKWFDIDIKLYNTWNIFINNIACWKDLIESMERFVEYLLDTENL